jgi:ribonucleoside-diphosphate reductase alpha chain
VAFAELFARSAHVMALAGRRAGAHLAILRDDHPDIVELVRARRDDPDRFPQLGFAVGVSDALLRAARDDAPWSLRHERSGTVRIPARDLLLEIARAILETGDPTLLFLDRIEQDNPTPALGRLRATNPCGEQPLLDGESCVLGSLQLPRFLRSDGSLDETRLGAAARDAVRFLDDAIEINVWPDDAIARAARRTRKVGLGVMGTADVLLRRGLAYDAPEARTFIDRVMRCIEREAQVATVALADERGAFPAWERGLRSRNATTRAVAPTGTLRLLAGCSAGIEPFLDPCVTLAYEGRELAWTDGWLLDWLGGRIDEPGVALQALAAGERHEVLPRLAEQDRRLLRRAFEIAPTDQLAMQACAQRSVDGAVSKTVHIDPVATPAPAELLGWVEQAHRLGCKGVAFYRGAARRGPARIDLDTACGHECER